MNCTSSVPDSKLGHLLSSSENVGCSVCLSIARDLHQRVHACAHLHSQQQQRPEGLVTASSRQLSSALLEELKGFCENTTIRGLPRIVRARTRTFRLLWSTFVAALTMSCLVCMFFLARQYYAYDVIHPPRVLRHAPSPFPSFTVCNLRPISPEGLQHLKANDWVTPRTYIKRLDGYRTQLYNNTAVLTSLSAGLTLSSYLESLGNNSERQKLGHQMEKFIFKCTMTYLFGGKPVSMPCAYGTKQRRFIHAQYLNCFTLDPDPEIRTQIMTVEVYLHLDEMPEHVTCPDCFLFELKSQLSGALLAIHANGQLPNINDKSINLKPGSLTEVRLATFQHVQKQPPHGHCDLNVPLALHLYDSSFEYSEHGCLEAAKQSGIIEQCGCYGLELPYNEFTGLPPCGKLPSFIHQLGCNPENLRRKDRNLTANARCVEEFEQFAQRIVCKQRVMESFIRGNNMTCAMPCSFYSYESELSTSYWPTKSMQLTWLDSSSGERLGFRNDSRFSAYRRAQALLREGNSSLAGEILASANSLERNLVAVLINRPNFDVHKVEEKEVLSMTSMLSQTGGLFSMWMGLTLISVGEILELVAGCFTRVTNHISRRRKRQSNHCDQQATSDWIDSKADDLNKEHLLLNTSNGNHCSSLPNCCCYCVYIFSSSSTKELCCKIFPLESHLKELPERVCEHRGNFHDANRDVSRHSDLNLSVHSQSDQGDNSDAKNARLSTSYNGGLAELSLSAKTSNQSIQTFPKKTKIALNHTETTESDLDVSP